MHNLHASKKEKQKVLRNHPHGVRGTKSRLWIVTKGFPTDTQAEAQRIKT